MTRLGAENLLAAGAVWLVIMLPSAAFGGDPSAGLRSPRSVCATDAACQIAADNDARPLLKVAA